MSSKILDACCGSRMMWFNKQHPDVVFADIREECHILCDGRALNVSPDIIQDFTKLTFADNTFHLVVFDPPHLVRAGKNSWLAKKYGVLGNSWECDIKQGFDECMRVLQQHGVLIFKWNETQITTSKIIEIIGMRPLFGHTSGRQAKTHWMTFIKS